MRKRTSEKRENVVFHTLACIICDIITNSNFPKINSSYREINFNISSECSVNPKVVKAILKPKYQQSTHVGNSDCL